MPTSGGAISSAVAPTAGSGAQASTTSSAARPVKVYRLRFSRDWIARTGPKRRRRTTLSFVLRRPALVEFVVLQVAPRCREVGRFRVRGRAGLNRVRFRGRIGRRVLGPGTYLIKARVTHARLVIVSRPNGADVKTARGADTCTRPVGQATTRTPAPAAKAKAARHRAATTRNKSQQKSQPARRHGVLGTRFTKIVKAVKSIPPVLFLLLAFAIALLALASLPMRVMPNSRTAALLAQNRAIFAGAGAIALAATMVSYVML